MPSSPASSSGPAHLSIGQVAARIGGTVTLDAACMPPVRCAQAVRGDGTVIKAHPTTLMLQVIACPASAGPGHDHGVHDAVVDAALDGTNLAWAVEEAIENLYLSGYAVQRVATKVAAEDKIRAALRRLIATPSRTCRALDGRCGEACAAQTRTQRTWPESPATPRGGPVRGETGSTSVERGMPRHLRRERNQRILPALITLVMIVAPMVLSLAGDHPGAAAALCVMVIVFFAAGAAMVFGDRPDHY